MASAYQNGTDSYSAIKFPYDNLKIVSTTSRILCLEKGVVINNLDYLPSYR